MIATRRPAGTGCSTMTRATSKSSVGVSTRMTPDCDSSAPMVASAGQSGSPSTPGARRWGVAPAAFTAMIGFRRDNRRARRVNFRGLPNDSR